MKKGHMLYVSFLGANHLMRMMIGKLVMNHDTEKKKHDAGNNFKQQMDTTLLHCCFLLVNMLTWDFH